MDFHLKGEWPGHGQFLLAPFQAKPINVDVVADGRNLGNPTRAGDKLLSWTDNYTIFVINGIANKVTTVQALHLQRPWLQCNATLQDNLGAHNHIRRSAAEELDNMDSLV